MEEGYTSYCVSCMYISNTTSTLLRVFMDGNDKGEPLTCNTEKDKKASVCIVVLQVNSTIYFVGIV